jgi:hypothetical protein
MKSYSEQLKKIYFFCVLINLYKNFFFRHKEYFIIISKKIYGTTFATDNPYINRFILKI